MAARVSDHHFQLHQIRLRGEMELRRRVGVRADADLVGLLRRNEARARRKNFGPPHGFEYIRVRA